MSIETVLEHVNLKSEELDSSVKALRLFKDEISKYPDNDVRFAPAYNTFINSIFKLSVEGTQLTLSKAKIGIVGKTWYKT